MHVMTGRLQLAKYLGYLTGSLSTTTPCPHCSVGTLSTLPSRNVPDERLVSNTNSTRSDQTSQTSAESSAATWRTQRSLGLRLSSPVNGESRIIQNPPTIPDCRQNHYSLLSWAMPNPPPPPNDQNPFDDGMPTCCHSI